MRVWLMAVLLAPALAMAAGPTEHIGEKLTKGAKKELTQGKTPEDLSRGARRIAGAATGGAAEELADLFGCKEKDRVPCVTERIRELSYAAARGTAQGAGSVSSPWGLVLAFVVGAVFALLVVALVTLLVGQRRHGRLLGRLTAQPA